MIGFTNLGNYGRLGNQMFQYAALRGIANQNSFSWVVPEQEKFKNTYHSTTNIFECFELLEARSNMQDVVFEELIHENASSNRLDEKIFYSCPDNVDLLGYFHSRRYFTSITNVIRKEFTFINKKNPVDLKNYISLHVRRDDYVGWFESICPQQNAEYFINSLELFDKKFPVIISSDDINWCSQQEFFQGKRFIFSEFNAYEDMLIMSNASGNIISNSTYAWWGAFLSKNKNVVLPKNWYGPLASHHSNKEYIIPGWIEM